MVHRPVDGARACRWCTGFRCIGPVARPHRRWPGLVGAVLAEQHDEWAEGRRYLGLDILARSRITLAPGATEVTPDKNLPALSA
jgi:hypothetical protein